MATRCSLWKASETVISFAWYAVLANPNKVRVRVITAEDEMYSLMCICVCV